MLELTFSHFISRLSFSQEADFLLFSSTYVTPIIHLIFTRHFSRSSCRRVSCCLILLLCSLFPFTYSFRLPLIVVRWWHPVELPQRKGLFLFFFFATWRQIHSQRRRSFILGLFFYASGPSGLPQWSLNDQLSQHIFILWYNTTQFAKY